jgi:hypothetical protein
MNFSDSADPSNGMPTPMNNPPCFVRPKKVHEGSWPGWRWYLG